MRFDVSAPARVLRIGVAAAALAVLTAGCAPKKVLREGSGPATMTPVAVEKADPRLPPELPDVEPRPVDPANVLPDPRLRVASGPSREAPAAPPPSGSGSRSRSATGLGDRAVVLAKQQLGKPYQWGATGPSKFDCSGLVYYVYKELGVMLPRVSGRQASAGVHVDREDLRPGDLVFFRLNGSKIDHVGLYVDNAKFIHAPRRHQPVKTESLNNAYWRRRFVGGRRVG